MGFFSRRTRSGNVPTDGSRFLNLGCGSHRHPEWLNADLVPSGPDVLAVDLRQPLPFSAGSFAAVYSSHVLEHLTPGEARGVLAEMFRVTRPGGVIRVVVPDLEGIARQYLATLDEVDATGSSTARWKHRWMIVELLDQMVRTTSGGAMGRWWSCDPVPVLDFILGRVGAEASRAIAAGREARSAAGAAAIAESDIFLTRPVSDRRLLRFLSSGERHKWMYDRVSLAEALEAAGFVEPRRMSAVTSRIEGFAGYGLDADQGGTVRKPDSLFMEAVVPGARA